jgi:hypothetical protein
MSYADLMEQVVQLPVNEKLNLLEVLTRSLREQLAPTDTRTRELKIEAAKRLRGIAKSEGKMPRDEELKEDYIN